MQNNFWTKAIFEICKRNFDLLSVHALEMSNFLLSLTLLINPISVDIVIID